MAINASQERSNVWSIESAADDDDDVDVDAMVNFIL